MTESQLRTEAKRAAANRNNTGEPATRAWLLSVCEDLDRDCELDRDTLERVARDLAR